MVRRWLNLISTDLDKEQYAFDQEDKAPFFSVNEFAIDNLQLQAEVVVSNLLARLLFWCRVSVLEGSYTNMEVSTIVAAIFAVLVFVCIIR